MIVVACEFEKLRKTLSYKKPTPLMINAFFKLSLIYWTFYQNRVASRGTLAVTYAVRVMHVGPSRRDHRTPASAMFHIDCG